MNRNVTIIGVTGNIATGKSTVMAMLARLGAYTIDADKLVHQLLTYDRSVQQKVVDRFGTDVQSPDGTIDRTLLSAIVFPDPVGMRDLEEILHPRVSRRVDDLIARSQASVVIIEAIKLLEGRLRARCQFIWVTDCRQEQQIERLMHGRRMTRHEALMRVLNQPPQEEKLAQADVVIGTSGSLEQTYRQVERAWHECTQAEDSEITEPTIRRAAPKDVNDLVIFMNQAQQGKAQIDRFQLLEAFGEHGYMLAERGGDIQAVAGWTTEDFIARISQVLIYPPNLQETVGKALLDTICESALEAMCEVALLFTPSDVSSQTKDFYTSCGFEVTALDDLIPAWQRAANQSMPEEGLVLVRKLRDKRVMRPI